MPESQVDRLKKELRFLKESFEAGIISEDEYMKGKRRIESKLSEWGEGVVESYGKKRETPKEKPPETKEIILEEVEEEKPEVEEYTDEKKKISEEDIKERVKEQDEREHLKVETKTLQSKLEEQNIIIKEKEKEEKKLKKEMTKIGREMKRKEDRLQKLKDKKKTKGASEIWKYTSLALILIIILLFFIKIKPEAEPVNIACYSDTDCSEGESCINKGTEESSCQLTTPTEVELMLLNDKNCKDCSTANTLQVIKNLFPKVNIKEFEYNTNLGKKLFKDYNIKYLPAYIFDITIEETNSWKTNERLKSSFELVNDRYLLKPDSSGSDYEPKK